MICAVAGCRHPKSRNRYFSFPKDETLCTEWLRFCSRKDKINNKEEKICMEHFLSDDFERDLPYELGVYSKPRPLKLKPSAVPSVYKRKAECDEKPAQYETRQLKRKKFMDALLKEYEEQLAEEQENEENEDVEVVIDASAYLTALEEENADMRKENLKLKLAAQRDAATIDQLEEQLSSSDTRYNQLCDSLRRIFSQAQLQRLQSGKRVVWQQKDLQESCLLYATSPSAYNMLLQKGYPLPSKRTLQHWNARGRLQATQQADEQPLLSEDREDIVQEQGQGQNSYDLMEAVHITQLDHNYGLDSVCE